MSALITAVTARVAGAPMCRERIGVCGTVQGVGFRPSVWRIAEAMGIRGSVANDGAGVLIDGLGFGDDGTFWGGEFFLTDYTGYRRLGTFKPVAMPGGDLAAREPWRSTCAHLMAEMGWSSFAMNYSELELYRDLERKPRALLDGMIKSGVNAPLASSCGRMFDAVAAAVGLARDRAWYEGQGAMELESAVDRDCLQNEAEALDYPFAIPGLFPYLKGNQ